MVSSRQQGFTLIEVLVTLAMVSIIAAVALPAYSSYVARSKVPPGLDALSSTATRLEQFYQDTGNYGVGSCGSGYVMPVPSTNYSAVTCVLTNLGQGFEMTVTGTGTLSGYQYYVNHRGERKTLAHPKGLPSSNCWSVKGTTCDAS